MQNSPSKRILEWMPSWLICLGLFSVGILLFVAPPHTRLTAMPKTSEVLSRLGEAFIVASLLAALVDPFLKRRLLKEASKNIFEHMLGFDLPQEMKEHLRSLVFTTVLYRRDVKMRFSIRPRDDHFVFIDAVVESEIINPSHNVAEYTPMLASVDVERAEHFEVTRIVNGEEAKTYPVEIKPDGEGYRKAEGSTIQIEPQSRGKRYRFITKYTCVAPVDWHQTIYYGLPTIDTTVTVSAPEGWTVLVERRSGVGTVIWNDPRLRVVGDKVEIHWRSRPSDSSEIPSA